VEDNMHLEGNVDGSVDEMGFEVQSDYELQEAYEEDALVHDPASPRAVVQTELAAIPEASTPSRKSKKRADSVEEHSLDWAERIKAARNLNFTSDKGNNSMSQASFIHFSNECVIDNLEVVGISLGNSSEQIEELVAWVKEVEIERLMGKRNNDLISDVFDKEEKDELANEEVDKLILNSLCCEIMDEVKDLGNAYP
jgi:hypothetical protein